MILLKLMKLNLEKYLFKYEVILVLKTKNKFEAILIANCINFE